MALLHTRNCLLILSLLLFVATSASADDGKRSMRRIVVEPIQFQIDVPTSWQITLNERLRGKAFFRAQGTTPDGRLIPASLSAIYMQPGEGKAYPQLPEPNEYAEIFSSILEANNVDFEIVRSAEYSIGEYSGVLVEYKQLQNDIPLRTAQINIVPPDGSERFIVTYSTFEQTVKVDFPFLIKLVDGIRLSAQDQEE